MGARAQRDSDPEYLRFRRRSVYLAVYMTLFVCALVFFYVATSWHRPHRGEIVGLALFATVSVLAIVAVRAERLVDTRWREPFFAAWSTLDVVIVVLLATLDGGAASPLTVTLFLPLVFAGLCYPRGVAALVAVATVIGCIVLGVMGGHGSHPGSVVYLVGTLITAAVMCVWQAYTLDRQRRELGAASRTDFLTGCLNRRGFDERLAGEIARAEREREPLGLVLFDLDGFKKVNDAHGHAAGDDLLRWVAARSGELLRPADALGRLGGDEFALLLAGADLPAARDVAARLVEALRPQAPVSAGVAVFPVDGEDGDALLRAADVELYTHKQRRPLVSAQ